MSAAATATTTPPQGATGIPNPGRFESREPALHSAMESMASDAARSLAVEQSTHEGTDSAHRVIFIAMPRISIRGLTSMQRFAGERSFEGAVATRREDAGRATSAAIDVELSERNLNPRMEGLRKAGTLLKALGPKGSTPITEWRPSAFFCESCDDCGGAGRHPCNNCDRNGQEKCPSYGCFYGRMNCHHCGGAGTVVYGNTRQNCNACLGGKVTCNTCWGRTVIDCRSCGGAAYFPCGPCGKTGLVTHAEGFALEAIHEPDVMLPDCLLKPFAEEWISGGLKGALDVPAPSGSDPNANLSAASLARLDTQPGKAPSYIYTIVGSFAEAMGFGKIGGKDYGAWAGKFDRLVTGFAGPVLDEMANEVARKLEETAANSTPKDFRAAAASKYGPMGGVLERCQTSGDGVGETAGLINRLFGGSIKPRTAQRIAAAQATCVANFGEVAARRSWRWPVRLMLLVPVLLLVMDLPWAAYNPRNQNQETLVFAGAAALIAFLLSVYADRSTRRAMRREVGSDRQCGRHRPGRVAMWGSMAASVALMALPLFEVDAPTLRSATREFREIVGVPHLQCSMHGSPYAEHCGAPI